MYPGRYSHFSNLASETINLRLKFDSRKKSVFWLLQNKDIFPYSLSLTLELKSVHFTQQTVRWLKVFFPSSLQNNSTTVQRQFNSLHLARKYARMIICSSKLTVFLELRVRKTVIKNGVRKTVIKNGVWKTVIKNDVRKTVNISEHIMSADKSLCTLVSRQMRPLFIYQACFQQLPISCLCRVARSKSFDQQWTEAAPLRFVKKNHRQQSVIKNGVKYFLSNLKSEETKKSY